jgi:5'-3' exonuclease
MLLDTSSLMYRAFYAVPQTVTDPSGQPINAVYGYLDMTSRLVGSHRPDEIMHVHDADWRPAPRVRIYAGYKAHRAPDPETLPVQFDTLQEILEAIGFPQAEALGWEAEDAIGALCAKLDAQTRVDIVTGDRDLIQLVRDPQVRVLFTVRGVSDLRELDEAGVLERFGVPAARYCEYAILRGDPSDGLPGVPGVGEKTARALIDAYPSLEAMLEDAARTTPTRRPIKGAPRLRARLRDAASYLATMQQLVPIRSDLELRTWAGAADDDRLDQLARRHGLGGPIRRIRDTLDESRSG